MRNRNLKLIAFTTVAGLFLTACGGGGSHSGGGTPAAVMVPACGAAVADVTGKTIKKTEDGAVVKIVHTPTAKKTACMIKGQAEII